MLDGRDPADRSAWEDLWNESPNREIFAHPGYVDLYSGPASRPFYAVAGAGAQGIVLPLLLREVSGENSRSIEGEVTRDITSPYGYGGPFLSGDVGVMQAGAQVLEGSIGVAESTSAQ